MTPPDDILGADDLDAEEMELVKRLAEIRKQKELVHLEQERLRLEAEREKPVTVNVISFTGGLVVTKADFREDLLKLWQSIPGRAFRGNGENAIPVIEWDKHVAEDITKLPNVTLVYKDGLKEAIENHLHAPVWNVEIKGNYIRLTPGPRYNTYDVNRIPGIMWDAIKHYFTVPLSEAWNLWEALKNIEGVIYSDEAKEFTIKQVEARAAIDKIGLAKDWEYEVALNNGVTLRPFQKVAAGFIEATNGRTLLAYQMGLGKTFIALAYAIKNNLRTLVICPASLKNNWCREIYRLSGKRAHVLQGAEPTNIDVVNLITDKHQQFTVINYDLVGRKTVIGGDITIGEDGYKHQSKTEDRYMWVDALNMARFDLIVCDEAHYAKNTDSNRTKAIMQLKCARMIHMTGTPVLNRPGELWPLLTTLAPATFPSEEAFVKRYTFNGKGARNVDELKLALKNIMIRRKQSDVVEDMPPLNRIEDWHELSPKAKKLYIKIEQGIWEAIGEYSNSGEHGGEFGITSILAKIMRLKQVCAIDKADSTADLAMRLADSAAEEKHNKVLIFTQFKAVAFRITQLLGDEALGFVDRGQADFQTVDNSERDRRVQEFQTNDKIKYLVVTEKTAKEGHNITKAGYVIFNDLFWTPANHEQGEGRAYMRIGDPHGIDSYYRIVDMNDDGIEEWIWELLAKKMGVIKATIEGVEESRGDSSSIAMDLINKMKEAMWTRKRK